MYSYAERGRSLVCSVETNPDQVKSRCRSIKLTFHRFAKLRLQGLQTYAKHVLPLHVFASPYEYVVRSTLHENSEGPYRVLVSTPVRLTLSIIVLNRYGAHTQEEADILPSCEISFMLVNDTE